MNIHKNIHNRLRHNKSLIINKSKRQYKINQFHLIISITQSSKIICARRYTICKPQSRLKDATSVMKHSNYTTPIIQYVKSETINKIK